MDSSYLVNQIVVPLALAIIMFAIGLNLHISSFKNLGKHPKPVITGLICQMIMLPLIAFGIANMITADPMIKLGLMLIASCPGGTGSNMISHVLKGNLELSVSLTTINSFLIFITIPAIILWSSDYFVLEAKNINLSFWTTFKKIMITTLIPVIVGMAFNKTFSALSDAIKPYTRYGILIILAVAFTLEVLYSDGGIDGLYDYFLEMFIPALILNLTAIVLGWLASAFILKDNKDAFTIGIETGLQNAALALFIATSIIGSYEMAAMALVYSSFSFFTTFGLNWLFKQRGEGFIKKLING